MASASPNHDAASTSGPRPTMLANQLRLRSWVQLESIQIADHLCTFEGEARVEPATMRTRQVATPDGYGRVWWQREECWYRGNLVNGKLQGDGTFSMRNGDRFHGTFAADRPVGSGTLAKLDGRRMTVEYPPHKTLLEDVVPTPLSSCPGPEHVIDRVLRVYTAACMRAGQGAKENDYGHIKSMHGKVAFAFPFRAHVPLRNAEQCRGKIVVTQRGGCSFAKKLLFVQDAGGIAMIVVGFDDRDRFNQVMQITQGQVPGATRLLRASIPAMYVLGKDEHLIAEGMLCRITFLPRTPRTPEAWFLGSIDVPPQTCYTEESEESAGNLLEDFREQRRRERQSEKRIMAKRQKKALELGEAMATTAREAQAMLQLQNAAAAAVGTEGREPAELGFFHRKLAAQLAAEVEKLA
ncbi:MAG: PA domain-containing protein, partial [Promethearchaeia archaeon]